jgi:hypothetical protein
LGQNVRVSEPGKVAPPLTADLIASGSHAADPVISPDGHWVAWSTSQAGEELRRLRITADGPAGDAEPVLRWAGDISGLVPLADGHIVAVVAGDERTKDDVLERVRSWFTHWLGDPVNG